MLRAVRRRSRSSCASAWRSFHQQQKLVEAQRIEQRTRFDLELLDQIGFCKGIENYSATPLRVALGIRHQR